MFSSWIWSIWTSALFNHLSIFTVAMNNSHHRTYACLLSTLMSQIRYPIVTAHHLLKKVLIWISSDLEVFSFLSCSESHLATNKAMSNLPSPIKSRTPWSFHSNGKIKGGKRTIMPTFRYQDGHTSFIHCPVSPTLLQTILMAWTQKLVRTLIRMSSNISPAFFLYKK